MMHINQTINLEHLRQLAKRKLPKIAFDFIDGGVDSEECLQRNRDVFRSFRLVPRYLKDVSKRDQSAVLLGRRYASPIGISPTGIAGLFRPGADLMLAQAAKEADVPFLLSSAANASLEEVMQVASEHVWFQMYGTTDDHINADLVQRAIAAKVQVLVISVDVPVNANRERNRRNGFSRPFRMSPAIMLEAMKHPSWVLNYLRSGGLPMMSNWAPYAPAGATASQVADLYGTLSPAPQISWKTIETIRSAWPGPLVIKGLLHVDDARQAAVLGVDGIIVSNHGGRQLDVAPSPLEVLPAMREAVGDHVELLLDSGVRRGSDIVIARCLGARFAFFGRPTLYGTVVAGTEGAKRALEIIRNEIDMVMAQIGCDRFEDLNLDYLLHSNH